MPESWRGPLKVNSPTRRLFSKAEIAFEGDKANCPIRHSDVARYRAAIENAFLVDTVMRADLPEPYTLNLTSYPTGGHYVWVVNDKVKARVVRRLVDPVIT